MASAIRFEQADGGWVIADAVAERGHDNPEDLEMVVGIIIRGPVDDGWGYESEAQAPT